MIIACAADVARHSAQWIPSLSNQDDDDDADVDDDVADMALMC